MWKLIYNGMLHLSRRGQRSVWKYVQKLGVDKLLCDEGFYAIATLGMVGERAGLPGVGGVDSLIHWQQLHWKSDLPVVCADKIAVRRFVKERIGAEYLIPMLPKENEGWLDVRQIPFDLLPEKFALKCNNSSARNLLVTDKSKFNVEASLSSLSHWLAPAVSEVREKHYSRIVSKIYCEKLMLDKEGRFPSDYKFMCNNGKVLFGWVDLNRFEKHTRTVVDTDFNCLDVAITCPQGSRNIVKPENWEQMLSLASKLSVGIPIVRVDLYNIDGRIYFGEMTFTPAGGFETFEPISFSYEMAAKADLTPFMEQCNE